MTKATSRRTGLFEITVTGVHHGEEVWPQAAGMAGKRMVRVHSLYQKHEAESKLEMAWVYKVSKHTSSDVLPSTRPHLPNLPKQTHQLGTLCLNTQAYGRHSHANPIVSLFKGFLPPTHGFRKWTLMSSHRVFAFALALHNHQKTS